MDKLNFVLASRWISPSNQGGVAMHNGYLIQALKGFEDVNLRIISLADDKNKEYYRKQGISFYDIEVNIPIWLVKLAKTNALKNALRSWKDWLISLRMAKVLEQNPPDVVEFMDIHSEAYAFLKRNQRGKRTTKVVIRSHTPWGVLRPTYLPEEIKGVDGWWAIEREQFCFDHCDAITTPSQDLKKQLIRLYGVPEEKITVIPNLLDTEHFRPLPSPPKHAFTFLHVGRFERAKGVITMTQAFIQLCKEIEEPIRLINVGAPRGAALRECMRLLQEAGLEDRVEFTGFVPYDDLPEYYAMADAVIVPPEIYESFSYTAAQAIACGKKVVVSDSGGMPETINQGLFGDSFNKGNEFFLKQKMQQIFQHDINSDQLVEYANSRFGMMNLSIDFYNLYFKHIS